MDNWMTPEHQAAALEGFLNNPVAVAYSNARARLRREPLEPGTIVRSSMASHSIWVKTNHGWMWIDRYTGEYQSVSDHCPMTDEEAMAGPEFWVQTWDGRTIKQWDRVGGGTT